MKITYNEHSDSTDDHDTFYDKRWELDSDNTSFTTFSMDTASPEDREHASNFMRSMSQFLDMWWDQYHLTTTSTGTDIRISISISKMDHK